MTSEIERLKAEVAATARMMAAARLVEGFGHASVRLPGGGFLMTSTAPLLSTTPETILTVDDSGNAIDAPAGKPLEIVIHAGIYRARPDVGSVCRGHGAAMAAWGVRGEPVPLLHGMGGLAGEVVPMHQDLALITTLESGDRMAATLGDNRSMLLLANGGVAVGADLLEAATRLVVPGGTLPGGRRGRAGGATGRGLGGAPQRQRPRVGARQGLVRGPLQRQLSGAPPPTPIRRGETEPVSHGPAAHASRRLAGAVLAVLLAGGVAGSVGAGPAMAQEAGPTPRSASRPASWRAARSSSDCSSATPTPPGPSRSCPSGASSPPMPLSTPGGGQKN